MSKLTEKPSRDEVLEFISKAASYGNLGTFIGAGFSKAVLNDPVTEIALSWGQLLEKAAEKLEVDYEGIYKTGVSYPDIASNICKLHSEREECDFSKSLSSLKREIAALTSWYPDREKRELFSGYLDVLSPSWIITTNYDLVIESLLTGKSVPLGPNDSLSSPKGVIPVFHLHGLRTNPEEIIIAQEDYVSLFRPSEYRQIKLALTIKESTTLFLGYGLGDVNVLTALDWSEHVFRGERGTYPNDVIQVLRKENPKEEPYRDNSGIVFIETEDLSNFFDEYVEVRKQFLVSENEERKALEELAANLDDPESELIEKFIDDEDYRKNMLKILSHFSIDLIAGFVSFLSKCIDETYSRSADSGAFGGYNQQLNLILDILNSFSIARFPPALFETSAYALQRVGYYVGHEMGKSWSAADTWESRKGELKEEIVVELNRFAKLHGYNNLRRLVDPLLPDS